MKLLLRRESYPVLWSAMAGVIIILDVQIGPFVQFPFLFLLPVLFASWYNGKWWGLAFAVILPLIRLYWVSMQSLPWSILESVVNAAIRMGVLTLVAFLTARVALQRRELEKEVQALEGLLPICSYCKKIRDESGKWNMLEQYISERSEAEFSHGICPDCLNKNYPDIADRMKKKYGPASGLT